METDALLSLNFEQVSGEIGALVQAFDALPKHVAKKYLKAAMRKALKPGVPALKAATPVGKVWRANKKGVFAMRRSGDLRRAAMAKSGYKGTNKDGFAWGALGYRYGADQRSASKKALWLEYGTSRMAARGIVQGVMRSFKPEAANNLLKEMALGLEKAATEIRDGRAVGTNYRRVRGRK